MSSYVLVARYVCHTDRSPANENFDGSVAAADLDVLTRSGRGQCQHSALLRQVRPVSENTGRSMKLAKQRTHGRQSSATTPLRRCKTSAEVHAHPPMGPSTILLRTVSGCWRETVRIRDRLSPRSRARVYRYRAMNASQIHGYVTYAILPAWETLLTDLARISADIQPKRRNLIET